MQEKAKDIPSFFDEHGFAILKAPTDVANWNTDHTCENSEVQTIYQAEIEKLIKEQLYSKETEFVQIGLDNHVIRRGPKSDYNFYLHGIHQDYAYTPEDYIQVTESNWGEEKAGEIKKEVDSALESAEVFEALCFWRPIENEKPLISDPLAVCSASSVKKESIVPTEIHGFTNDIAPRQLSLKQDDD